jgi:hypothetical protein
MPMHGRWAGMCARSPPAWCDGTWLQRVPPPTQDYQQVGEERVRQLQYVN